MKILSFESSCDETAAAVLEMHDPAGEDPSRRVRRILSSLVASQAETHALYGGVVPEIASRAHTEAISSLAYGALGQAGVSMEDIDAVAVTAYPGLIGALLVGTNFAKSLAYAYGKPLIAVDHILGHIAACYLTHKALTPPFFAMVASGGHCSLMQVDDYTAAHVVGRTRDDAIGECFDKAARVIGLPYPGGKEMDRLASLGDPEAIPFPSAAITGTDENGLPTLDFSFSGLKTAALNYANHCKQAGTPLPREDFAASFTAAVCRSVRKRLEESHSRFGFTKFVMGGGVCANSHLRRMLEDFGRSKKVEIYLPDLALCGDNAAMIGAQGYYDALAGNFAPLSLNPSAAGKL